MEIEHLYYALLYRHGAETASNTIYALSINHILTPSQIRDRNLEFVQRYNNVPGPKVDLISQEVDKYKGPQTGLTKIIDDILKK